MHRKIVLLIVLISLVLPTSVLNAQSFMVDGLSGMLGAIPLDEIQKIVFSDDQVIIKKASSEESFSFEEIRRILFSDTVTSGTFVPGPELGSAARVLIYPNPATQYANIKIESEEVCEVDILIFNTLGSLVYSRNETVDPGIHYWEWRTANHPAGIYLCRVRTNEELVTRKIIITK